jgi:copper(I)-binding protein
VKKRLLEAALLFSGVLAASHAVAAQVSLSGAWFRALPSNLPAGGYFTLHNGGANIQLTGAQSPACGMLMLHKSSEAGGMSSMMMVESVEVPAGASVEFSPGGYHLMCTGPTAAMTPGAQVPVTFKFSDGTTTTVNFAVKNANGK